jgi:hypothetical protein
MERLLWSNWMERLLCASLLLVGLVPGVRAVELEVKGAKDVTLATGAEFRDKPLARSGGTGALIRSGNPNDHSTATVIEPSPDPIKRVQLDIEYLIGFESDGVPPVLSVWVQDTPDPTAPGGKQVYESGKDSPPLKCDTKAKRTATQPATIRISATATRPPSVWTPSVPSARASTCRCGSRIMR